MVEEAQHRRRNRREYAMTRTAGHLLETLTAKLAPDPDDNPLLPLIAAGTADRATLAVLALEQHLVIASDHRSFARLARRAATEAPASAAFFRLLADGETVAAGHLTVFARACGVDEERAAAHEPLPGCQAYPSYVARLALEAAPADAVLALTANFASWGGYCATIARALRHHYDLTDEACAFFDFFAEPSPDLDKSARAAVEEGCEAGRLDERLAQRHGRLLQSYESMFWSTLARL
jgi:hypothetical protein